MGARAGGALAIQRRTPAATASPAATPIVRDDGIRDEGIRDEGGDERRGIVSIGATRPAGSIAAMRDESRSFSASPSLIYERREAPSGATKTL